jgi:PAS domain S-box-containing protein
MPSEETFPQLPKDAPVMFHSVDRDGILVDVSQHWLAVMGYRRDEVIGRKSTEFLTEASRRYAEEVVLPEYFSSGFCTNVPYQIVTKSGKVLDIALSATAERDEAGKVVRSLAVLTDLTERKRAEKARQDAEAVFSKAFRSSATIMVISTLDGRLVEVNDAFERTLGHSRAEAIGQDVSRLQIWENAADREKYVRLLKGKGEIRDLEVRFRSKPGSCVVGLLSGQIIDFKGEACVLSQFHDITERKRAAEEIEVLHTDLAARAFELELANEALEAFSYTVSHDLRKPLTAISGYCQVILEMCGHELDANCERYVKEIINGTLRMNQLIETLLDYSRVSHVKVEREAVDLSALAAQVARELAALEPQRRVCFEIAQGVTDRGDPDLLRIVMENLLGNAWKYSAQKEEARIEFGAEDSDGRRSYFVRDNGVGFERSSAEGLFTAFKRLPGAEQFKGFGIGLATVGRIISSHGGKVWAEGEKGQGAVFHFTLG